MENSHAQLRQDHEQLAADFDKLRTHVRGLDKVAELADMDVQRVTSDLEYDRAPNVALLRANAAELFSKSALVSVVHSLAEECELKHGDLEIMGSENGLSRNYAIQFKGAGGIGERRARKFMALARGSPPEYRTHMAKAPGAGRQVRLYFNIDKSKRQQRTENEAKRLRGIMQEKISSKEVGCIRKDGVITVDWVPVCKVECPSPDLPPKILFAPNAVNLLAGLGVQREEICRIFREDEQRRGRARLSEIEFTQI